MAAQIINVNLKKGASPISATDFFPEDDEDDEQCDVEGILNTFRALKPGRN